MVKIVAGLGGIQERDCLNFRRGKQIEGHFNSIPIDYSNYWSEEKKFSFSRNRMVVIDNNAKCNQKEMGGWVSCSG